MFDNFHKNYSNRDVTQLASMCKLKCGRLVREVADSCLQFWGGMGFTNEVMVSRMYRLVVFTHSTHIIVLSSTFSFIET